MNHHFTSRFRLCFEDKKLSEKFIFMEENRMLLKKTCNQTIYLNAYIESDEIHDQIDMGRVKYPVEALCDDCRWKDAVALVRKGYQMLHPECFAREFVDILYALEKNSHVKAYEKKILKEELKQGLIDSVNVLEDCDIRKIADEFASRLYNVPERYGQLIATLRLEFSVVYKAFLDCDTLKEHFVSILLCCNDLSFVRDYMSGLEPSVQCQQIVREFSLGFTAGEVGLESNIRRDIFQIIINANENTLISLNTIMRYQPEILSHDLYWKLAILIVMCIARKMKRSVEGVDTFAWDDEILKQFLPDITVLLDELERMLTTYQLEPEHEPVIGGENGIMFMLIDLCGYYGFEAGPFEKGFDEEVELPDRVDVMVLQRVIQVGKKIHEFSWNDSSIEILVSGIKHRALEWENRMEEDDFEFLIHNAEEIENDFYQMFARYSDWFWDVDVQ